MFDFAFLFFAKAHGVIYAMRVRYCIIFLFKIQDIFLHCAPNYKMLTFSTRACHFFVSMLIFFPFLLFCLAEANFCLHFPLYVAWRVKLNAFFGFLFHFSSFPNRSSVLTFHAKYAILFKRYYIKKGPNA